ncbi:permease [Levilactobacillus namurensis]|uniref:DMT family transporter n=1 Tax=Levilactobacillus namurensis TaxID=380393 RepID=A0AAW8W7L8_9LACO|nr:DMT family transporter [Levilactobacillus namurensis]PTM22371.1 EamA/RhaT family transporter [Lactobacillus sp. PFC-70]MCW3777493.1 DMT family transporter [Levilactobacillus namurensis]MDT7014383.1 DMT family transporter [Levilactobacillus namurensis]MDT7018692.1 DMT family transporter [Levilactobacillus namurensis]WNN66683.1 DMT family transporter [Levilactobacillus namurensis]
MKKIAPVFVALGAISFGVPASLFKIARREGVVNGPLLFWSFLSAVVILGIVHVVRRNWLRYQHTNWKQIGLVIAAGTGSGFTNTFYIQALKLIPVAAAAVMLMQAVWLSVLLGAVIQRRWPSRLQVLSIVLVLIGTVLAAGLFPITQALSPLGLFYAFLAACGYACTMQFTALLGNNLDPMTKTWLLCLGAFILISIVWIPQIATTPVTLPTIKWGVLIALFSMVFPLVAYSLFMPQLDLGIGPILSSLELPSSIVVAFILLGETVSGQQILGVFIIIAAVVLPNVWGMWHRQQVHPRS